MRTHLALALTGAALTGCTVIPPADPARMQSYPQASAPPPPQALPTQRPLPATPPPAAAYPGPGVTPPYTPAQTYTASPELPPAAPRPSLTYAALGQTVTVGGPRITPLAVLEDSRCPMNARCVWAGQVRLRIRIDSGRGGEVEVTSGKPVTVADGALELVEVQPDKVAGSDNHGTLAQSAYRFGFRFMGGY